MCTFHPPRRLDTGDGAIDCGALVRAKWLVIEGHLARLLEGNGHFPLWPLRGNVTPEEGRVPAMTSSEHVSWVLRLTELGSKTCPKVYGLGEDSVRSL